QAPKSDGPPLPAGAVARLRAARLNHGSRIANVLVTPDGRTILTQGERSIRVWDATTRMDAGTLDLPDAGPGSWTSLLTPDAKTVLTTRSNGTAQVWALPDRDVYQA